MSCNFLILTIILIIGLTGPLNSILVNAVQEQSDTNSADSNGNGVRVGDIVFPPKFVNPNNLRRVRRQGIRFDRYPGSKWLNGIVPYNISVDFNNGDRQTIQNAINRWNNQLSCLTFKPRTNERDYVHIYPGSGCWSYLGRIGDGKQEGKSLQANGCLSNGTIFHEFIHAIGFAHENSRPDRDSYISIKWSNIPQSWKSQYEKTNPDDYGLHGSYDYYSIMHYSVSAPEKNPNPVFDVLRSVRDERRIGNGNDLTDEDLNKISRLYC